MERTLPWSWYSDPDFTRREAQRIFARAWQYAGHSGQVAEPGSFFASWAGEIPVVVTRARDGELRAFLNVCRHRGSMVAQGEGKRETLQCGYHAWTYGLDGKLRAAPRSDREENFDAGELGLLPAAVDTWGPFVFVNPEPEAAPLAATLGEVPALLAELIDLDTLEHRFRLEWEVAANWKVACENFLECYHCAVAHPTFSAVVDVAPDAYRLRTSGLTSSQFGPLRENGGSPFADGEIGRSQFHFVWPNFGINVFPGRPNLSCGPMLPRGPERTGRFLDYFFAPDVEQEWIDDLLELDNQVGREDTTLVEGVQRGIRSGVLEAGRLMSASEPLIAHFQRLTADALRADGAG
jgi:phenylpropionate dioxygenase-like ring-hydroxylating dioxygenase large terminal subunit